MIYIMNGAYVECLGTYKRKGVHGVPAIAASTRLRVGLGGADSPREPEEESSCSGRRVFPCLIDFGSPPASFRLIVEMEVW